MRVPSTSKRQIVFLRGRSSRGGYEGAVDIVAIGLGYKPGLLVILKCNWQYEDLKERLRRGKDEFKIGMVGEALSY